MIHKLIKSALQISFIVLLLNTTLLFGQNISINQTFTQDEQVYEFQNHDPIYSCKLTGSVSLNSEMSLIRVILVSESNQELIIYEVFPSIFENSTLTDVYYETCFLDGIIPDQIKVQVVDASITINSFYVEDEYIENALQLQGTEKLNIETSRIELINDYILENELIWYAGMNPKVEMTYEEKRNKFEDGVVPNLQGMEYYVGGFFSFGTTIPNPIKSDLVDNFDWRNRHGANNPSSPYFDGDYDDKGGWIPPRFQQQGAADCYAFAPTYTIQALTNLYFNQHLDINLSEQDVISCKYLVPSGGDGSTGKASRYITEYGIVDEACFPYIENPIPPCSDKCLDPDEKIQPSDYDWYLGTPQDEFTIKNDIIENGCLVARTYTSIGHAMILVGFGKVKVGDEIFFVPPMDEEIIIPPGSPYLGQTYWIFEQSWGLWNNETTFIYIIIPPEQLRIHIMKEPISSINYDQNDIACLDLDNDGYYNWGIADAKPPTCPTCPPEPDCDDSNNWLGPFDTEYNCQLLCDNFTYQPESYYINSTVTYQDVNYFDSDIIITSGNEMIVEGEINMVEGAKIIIQTEAKLTIDGGIITGACGNMWKGIEVWGSPSSPYQNDQGLLTIKNGAVIENAEVAIRNYHFDQDLVPPDNHHGGITKALNSSFVNNQKTFDIKSYNYISNNYIRDCEFEYNQNYLGGADPSYFIEIRYMKGVSIISCDFINNTGENYKGNGIYSHYSQVNIRGKCISAVSPCTAWENGTFVNLAYGIYAKDHLFGKYVDIRNNTFNQCQRGVYISGIDGARVTSNEFAMPASSYIDVQKYGLYLNTSTGYHVEDNIFKGPSPTQLGKIGLYINHSGIDWNQIYNNTFENLNYGTIAFGNNRDGVVNGLCIECNDYANNKNDIVINGKKDLGHGIAYNQGLQGPHDTLPAGNTFTQNFPELESNYYNADGMGFIEYVYHGENWTNEQLNPEEYYSPQTMHKGPNPLAEYNKLSACPSKLNSNGGHPTDDRKDIADSDAEIEAKEAQLAALVDGGDTDEMNFDVMLSAPPEAGEVYQDLMAQSPFLSDTVIKTAIYKENVLPNVMIRDVLVANPQSAKENEILEAMDERFDPMPQWMKDQVLQGVNVTSAKEAIESDLAKWKQKRGEHFNNLYQYFRKDSINPQLSADSLEMLLTDDPYLASKYRLAFFYYEKQDYNPMNIVLNNIPSVFELTNTQQAVYQDYLLLFGILEQLAGNEQLLDSLQVNQLEMLAEKDDYFPGAYARDMLIAAWLKDYEEPIILPEFLKSSTAIGGPFNPLDKPEIMKVFPNPAKDYIIVDYYVDDHFGEILFSIRDIAGKPLYTEVYSLNRDQKVINTKDWNSGVYLISLFVNGKTVKSTKLTIK